MKTKSIRVAPPNSMIFISDAQRGRVRMPDPWAFVPSARVISNDTFIAVFCMFDQEGDTAITIGKADNIDPGQHPVFDGTLETPTCTLIVSTVEWTELLRAKVFDRTRVKVWTNRPDWPDQVIIGLSDGA